MCLVCQILDASRSYLPNFDAEEDSMRSGLPFGTIPPLVTKAIVAFDVGNGRAGLHAIELGHGILCSKTLA